MWKTGEVMGYRWEAITDGKNIRKMVVYKKQKVVNPSAFLLFYIKIAVMSK